MKQRILLLMITLLACVNLRATTYYIKFTASDGTVYWPKLELVWNSRYNCYDTFSLEWSYKNIKGGLDFDEIWTESGGSGTKITIYEIASGAFFSWEQLTSVKGSSIKKIRNQAFHYCSSLTSINFPNLQVMEDYAFAYCSSLVSYMIPASATSIDGRAFCHSSSLTNLTVDSNNYYYSCENNILYNKNKTTLYAFLSCRNDTALTIPSTIKTIGKGAFENNWTLRSVIISNGVETISDNAFSYSRIKSVVIPTSVTTIKSYAFGSCNNLESIKVLNPTPIVLQSNVFPNTATLYVPAGSKTEYENANYWNSVAEIKEYAPSPVIQFADATVKSICVSNWDYSGDGELDEEEAKVVKELGTQFMNNTAITSFDELQYFGNLQHIVASAFSGCTNLSSVVVPASLTSIGYNAFLNTAWLNAQPDGLLYIGNVLYAYRGTMPQNTKIVVKDGTTSICDYAFYNKQGLTEIELPNSLISIGSETEGYVFSGCSGLTAITIPSGVKKIVRYAFSNTGLTSVVLPDGLESIGNSSFRSCNSLESIVIPNRVTSIGKNTFRSCTNLKSVTMPYYLQTVATDAFRDCYQLQAVYISNLGAWCNIAFEDYRANPLTFAHHLYLNGEEVINLEIPSSDYNGSEIAPDGQWSGSYYYEMNTIKPLVFYGCNNIKSVSIPAKIKSIGANAFSNCTALAAVKMKSTPFELTSNAFPTRANVSLYTPKGYVNQYQEANVWKEFKAIKGYPDADVNCDGDIDVVDVVDIVRYTLDDPSDDFDHFLADQNNDGNINLSDAKSEVNNVTYSTTLTAIEPEPNQPNKVALENFEVRARKKCVASITLENTSEELVGFQMDMTLPEGVSLDVNTCRLSDRISDEEQQLNIRKFGNNTYRLTSTSLSLQPITRNEGELISLYLDATNLATSGTITITNIRFATRSSERLVLENADYDVQPIEYMQFCEGDGTAENPFLLFDYNDFANLAQDVNSATTYEGSFFKVANPIIDFSGVNYTAIGSESKPFAGSFDGNDVVIKNLSASKALFGYIGKKGSVMNIVIDESCIINGSTSNVAGIAGASRGMISNCINHASVTSTSYHVAGICGDNMGTISNCKNYGAISISHDDTSMGGGIAGDLDGGKILNCENYGNVIGSRFWVGGIVGLVCGINSVIDGCSNRGNVTGLYDVGGIVGTSSDAFLSISNNLVTDCVIYGTSSTSPMNAGAISAGCNCVLSNNYYTQDVVVKAGTNTYDGTTPRGIWGSNEPQDITNNNGAVLLNELIMGDVNGNGGIDIGDAVSVVNYLVGKTSSNFIEQAADTNKNGQIDIGDAVTIVNYLVGKTASLSREAIIEDEEHEREPQ